MNKYILMGKNSQETAASMLNKPQNRKELNKPLFDAFNVKIIEFLYLNHPDFDILSEDLMLTIVRAILVIINNEAINAVERVNKSALPLGDIPSDPPPIPKAPPSAR